MSRGVSSDDRGASLGDRRRYDCTTREAELKQLPDLVKKHFKTWFTGAKPFQIDSMKAQVMGKDVLIHAATGSGKTGIAAGPHLLESNRGRVTLVISPLIALHNEQVNTFKEEFGLSAMAVNSAHGGCTHSIMKKITQGEWQIVLLSPEMAQSRRFIQHVLHDKEFGARILSVFVDEDHCVSHWGDSFRKKYGTLGNIRAHLPHHIPFIAVSATMTARLQYHPSDYLFINIGNDRPAVSQVVRAIEHPMNTHADLDFLVPSSQMTISDIPKTFLYTDDIKAGSAIVDHLNSRVDPQFRQFGLIRPYSAAMSQKYRTAAMRLFKGGIIRILICTDAAGMGCNIPDVDIVVQWKLPPTLSAWIQRAGRAARGHGRQGLAVMLAEKASFLVDPTAPDLTAAMPSSRSHDSAVRQAYPAGKKDPSPPARKKMPAGYAVRHGQHRGSSDGKHNAVEFSDEPDLDPRAAKEGLYAYIQTTCCRRQLLGKVYGNESSAVTPQQCCDVCNPSLFSRVQPPLRTRTPRQQSVKKHEPRHDVREDLYAWQKAVKHENYPHSVISSSGILSDDVCELLASVTPIPSKSKLYEVFGSEWARWDQLSDSLYTLLHTTKLRSVQPKSAAQQAQRAQRQHLKHLVLHLDLTRQLQDIPELHMPRYPPWAINHQWRHRT
ncbi:P-loop containing nucleoside triphosphate hydrolase protein [Amylostereum chailletii]|nr:P-loop containing nucleoside triphosphate hydrolase protein [Amylostereum chailletii]